MLIPRGGVEDTRLEAMAKDKKKFRGQGQTLSRPRPRTKDTDASVLQKKKGFKNFFSGDLKKKHLQKIFSGEKGLQKFVFERSLLEETKNKVFADFLQGFWRFPTKFQRFKNSAVLEPRTGQFRGLEALRPRASKCVLEAKNVLEDSTSSYSHLCSQCVSPLTTSWAKCALRELKPTAKIARRALYPLDLVSHIVAVSKCRI